jgi:TolB protein
MKMINHILGVPLAMVAALVLLTAGPARAVVEIDINRANVEPLPIAITDFISNDELGRRRSPRLCRRSEAVRAVCADRQGRLHREDLQSRCSPRFEDWRVINAQALVTGRLARKPTDGCAPSSGCGTRLQTSSCGRAVLHQAGELAARGPYHRRCDL